jgi:hypothetical protein
MPRYLVVNTDLNGEEYPWLVDDVVPMPCGNVELWRDGDMIITLGPEDYAGGLIQAPWDADIEFEGSLGDYIEQVEDDDVLVIHRTIH